MKFILLILFLPAVLQGQDLQKKIQLGSLTREYIVHVPKNFNPKEKHPLVLIFHGGGGTAKRSLAFFGFNTVSDTAGFIAVYPNGINKGWNDGRQVPKHTNDDVGFIKQLIVQLKKDYPVDETRIFATGISNGGFFCFALGLHLADQLRAIAPVCATIPKDIFNNYNPARLPGLLLINGTKDPLVPYDGGKVGGKWLSRGECVSTEKTIEQFVQVNQGGDAVTQIKMPNPIIDDGCKAMRLIFHCDLNEVQLIRIDGGGHTWPGGKQYLGKKLVGNVCKDFSATAEIWKFFRKF